jgi:YidC/Oxa1 family membrane protein insertase
VDTTRCHDRSEEFPAINLGSLFDIFLPIHTAWWAIFGQTLSWGLFGIYGLLEANPVTAAIGAYGLAIIALTLIVRLVLSPLFHYQIRMGRRAMEQQRKLSPELSEIRRKYKNDPLKQQEAMRQLYQKHGVNPFSQLSGCLPALLQLPILTALYYVFRGTAQRAGFSDHFLFVPHLTAVPQSVPLVHGLPIPALAYLVIPVLAAASTFVQSKMMQQPLSANPTEQELQTQQLNRTMQFMMPLMIFYFAIITPAGLGLYWFVSNCFSIMQQYFVTGWGGLGRQPASAPAPGGPAGTGRPGVPSRSPESTRSTLPPPSRAATERQGAGRSAKRTRRARK